MLTWLGLGFAITGLVWWIGSRLSAYRRLFADRHLMEVAQRLAALKQAALRDIIAADGRDIRAPDHPSILHTSAGLVLLYTVSCRPPGIFVHHASVSIPGRVTAHAVGETFILLWARMLGIGYERLTLSVSPTTVHHAEFVLDEREQADFVSRPVETPTIELLQTFQAECLSIRPGLNRSRGATDTR
jgi:hypothetical protein